MDEVTVKQISHFGSHHLLLTDVDLELSLVGLVVDFTLVHHCQEGENNV